MKKYQTLDKIGCSTLHRPDKPLMTKPHTNIDPYKSTQSTLFHPNPFINLTKSHQLIYPLNKKKKPTMSYKITYDASLAPPRAPALVAFMEDFYRTSDTESQHEEYVQSFAEDATLIMGSKQAQGSSGMSSPMIYLIRPAHTEIR